jgi:uncharacterized protein
VSLTYDPPMFAVQLAFSDDARLALRPQHRDRLAALASQGKLLGAGPWPDESGALLIFVLAGREELDQLMSADPYYTTSGVSVASIHEWNPVTRHPALAEL